LDLFVGETTRSARDTSLLETVGEGASISAEGGAELVEIQTGLVASDDHVNIVASQANLGLLALS
jgi:hypothetical protein